MESKTPDNREICSSQKPNVSVLSPGDRTAGILLPVASLPSPYGIGDLGPAAKAWIDYLSELGQSWWQFLPLGPTGYGNSPYSSTSSFAGNWLLISPDGLIADGLIQPSDVAGCSFPEDTVDYEKVGDFKQRLLTAAWSGFLNGAAPELIPAFEQFCHEQARWLDDYALFSALKTRYQGASYLQWPGDLLSRDAAALLAARHELANELDRVRLSQFLFFRQGRQLREYAHAKAVHLIGDLPFYVSSDSSDVWANPELFQLDEQHRPRFVAGVPPDVFSQQGQLWGNPVYDWKSIRDTGYRWCIDRMRSLLSHVDLIRLDHFRGFAAAWNVPAESRSARSGQWVPGPGTDFFNTVQSELGHLPFIAEDLGVITPDVTELRDQFQLPGTRVLQFAFDGQPDNTYLPQNYVPNTVVYTGTHDNDTTRGWFEQLSPDRQDFVRQYLHRPNLANNEVSPALIHVAWSSVAAVAITSLQDLLNLGSDARMNVPGCAEGNWRWRCTSEMLNSPGFQWLRELTILSSRRPVHEQNGRSIQNTGRRAID